MAAGDSPTSIANLALALLSEDPIGNIDPPDNNKRGRLARQFYDPARRAMLAAAPWREAKRQAQLAAATTAPAFTYGRAYPVPADFIRWYDLPEDGGTDWEMMNLAGVGLCVVTDAGPALDVTYVMDLDDCTLMSPLLVMALASEIGTLMALPLARDMSLKAACEAQRDRYLSLARSVSAQQANPREWDTDVLLRSRY